MNRTLQVAKGMVKSLTCHFFKFTRDMEIQIDTGPKVSTNFCKSNENNLSKTGPLKLGFESSHGRFEEF